MRKIIFILFISSFYFNVVNAQTVKGNFQIIQSNNSEIMVNVQIGLQQGTANLGNAVIRFNFNNTALAFPQNPIKNTDYIIHNLDSSDYSSSVSLSSPGVASINIAQVGSNYFNLSSNYIDIATIYFKLNNPNDSLGIKTELLQFFSPASSNEWTIGAWNVNYTIKINLNATVILGGCYSNGTMSNTLLTRGFLPNNQPYNAAPWNYNGTETVNSFPAHTVDWVLLELRSDTSSSSIVARRAALLLNNGSVVDLDGTSPVGFNGIQSGSYYLVIKHRNHLGVMSAHKLNFTTSGIINYNFTDSQSEAYGINPMDSLGNGVYGLFAGDGNADGVVSKSDITNVWLPQFLNGIDSYNSADFNLDGSVTASDNNLYWLLDDSKSSQVPK